MTLTPFERLELIEQLWDSLATTSEDLELTDAQRDELDRRIAEMDANPDSGIPWESVKAELRDPG
jgi:putative addiction module component (TIGR02574 family)